MAMIVKSVKIWFPLQKGKGTRNYECSKGNLTCSKCMSFPRSLTFMSTLDMLVEIIVTRNG